jgi:hypothetical protein
MAGLGKGDVAAALTPSLKVCSLEGGDRLPPRDAGQMRH